MLLYFVNVQEVGAGGSIFSKLSEHRPLFGYFSDLAFHRTVFGKC